VTLTSPFSIGDDTVTVSCPATASLAPGGSITCSATDTLAQADIDAGSVTNHATGHGKFGATTIDSNQATATVTIPQTASLSLSKSGPLPPDVVAPNSRADVGDTITYSYTLTNTGNVTLTSPFSIGDDTVTVSCPPTASLAPGGSITCSATDTLAQADIDAGSVTNHATGHGKF